MSAPLAVSPALRAFCDRVIVPALLERFLRDQAVAASPPPPGNDFNKPEARA
jgi:hypothetical protein